MQVVNSKQNKYVSNQGLTQNYSTPYIRDVGRKLSQVANPGPLARNVRRLRIAAGMKQPQLAEATGGVVLQGEISKIENGVTDDPGRAKAEALARVFKVTVDSLYADIDDGALDPSLAAFFNSDFGRDISEAEKLILAAAGLPPSPLEAWWHFLQGWRMVRAQKGPPQP